MKDKRNGKQRLNWKIIASDLQEAREQLEEIEERIKKKDYLDEGELYLAFQHAYHHLNIAWNARKIRTKEYTEMNDTDFNRWSKFPKEIDAMKAKIKKTAKKGS